MMDFALIEKLKRGFYERKREETCTSVTTSRSLLEGRNCHTLIAIEGLKAEKLPYH